MLSHDSASNSTSPIGNYPTGRRNSMTFRMQNPPMIRPKSAAGRKPCGIMLYPAILRKRNRKIQSGNSTY